MLPNTRSLFSGSLTSFSSISGFSEVSSISNGPAQKLTQKLKQIIVIINHISGLPQSFTQILKFTFHHNIEEEVQARLSFPEMDICHAREEQEFHSSETEFCF